MTYGDFKKHDSPTRRFVKQKNETVKHKHVFKAKNPDAKERGLYYSVGTEKAYDVVPKGNIDYDKAEKKPMEFIAKVEAQEQLKKKVKHQPGARRNTFVYSEKETLTDLVI